MALLITPAEIAAATNVATVEADVQIAQDIIEGAAGRDLFTELPEDRFEAPDLRRLRLAIQWQTVYLAKNPEVLTKARVKRAAANGASVEFDDDQLLAPLAERFLSQCSWSSGAVQVRTLKPVRDRYRRQPDPWVRIA